MKSAKGKFFATLCLLMTLFVLFGPYGDSRVSAVDSSTYRSLKIFNEVLDIVEKNYVEEVKQNKLINEAVNGMIRSLDPHSAYLTPDQYKELQVDTSGTFGGLGIVISMQNDQLTVVSPIEDTPAFKAGIKAGDRIMKIDGQITKGMSIQDAVKKMRGPENTKVTLTILRKDMKEPRDYEITRAVIKIKSVKHNVYEDGIGYIRISAFQESTVDELKKALQQVNGKAKNLKGIVIDVRNNPGGLLDQAVKASDAFLKSGTIVSTKGRVKAIESKFVARDDGAEPTCPMVVLVNEGTASASEILSGALQDNGRAIVLGMPTFGKGSVQTVIPLEDGSALKLTTARYYTPKGRSIQAEGIKPDIVVEPIRPAEGPETAENHMMREKDLKGHIRGDREGEQKPADGKDKGDREKGREKTDLQRDNQLKSAVDILKSWEVFKRIGKN
ncbi:MAG: putative CtpA-like serine protease [Syntrophaceae bacterium PtaB.Bin038]|nr:MAG: putative CtpA-like serine protease [Syntrophaceae bacterium PtaB.Bin038]